MSMIIAKPSTSSTQTRVVTNSQPQLPTQEMLNGKLMEVVGQLSPVSIEAYPWMKLRRD